ncbi:MAG: exodeoxyribonuclease VII large subunit [Lentisphaeria bacterium]|nr:exodeoxyribonuclease VII large subunit [Lentisphaeria bacterium]
MNGEHSAVFTVSDVNSLIRDLFDGAFQPLWVTGEVGNLTIHRSGHVYMTLKDASSQLRAVYFGGAAVCSAMKLREGMKVEAFGKLSVYSPRGEYQLVVRTIRPFGLGDLQLKFEELKKRLSEEGLFDEARKKPVPFLPRRIAVVTSTEGAALHDFLRISLARFPGLHIRIVPAPVQGKAAAPKLAEALRIINRECAADVIVLTRGGGSLEDLWPFNEEVLARAIAESVIPVVSAVGHEIDFTISDFVADLRAPTPSGAAEMIVPEFEALKESVDSFSSRLRTTALLQWEQARTRVENACRSRAFLDLSYQLDELTQRLDRDLTDAEDALERSVERAERSLDRTLAELEAYSPFGVLKRGYAVVTGSGGHVVSSLRDAVPGQEVSVRISDGSFTARVESTGAPE